MSRLLLLRPQPGATASLERARALGLEAKCRPLFDVQPIDWDLPDPADFDALLLTSANAPRHAGPGLGRLAHLLVHAVGEATAEAARHAGLTVASVGDGGADSLLGSLSGDQRLLHLCGVDHHPATGRHRVTALPVYAAAVVADPDLPPLAGWTVAVHSPRAGSRLAELVGDRSATAIAAVSPAAAAACGSGWQVVEVAEAPSDSALLVLAARLCNTPPR